MGTQTALEGSKAAWPPQSLGQGRTVLPLGWETVTPTALTQPSLPTPRPQRCCRLYPSSMARNTVQSLHATYTVFYGSYVSIAHSEESKQKS